MATSTPLDQVQKPPFYPECAQVWERDGDGGEPPDDDRTLTSADLDRWGPEVQFASIHELEYLANEFAFTTLRTPTAILDVPADAMRKMLTLLRAEPDYEPGVGSLDRHFAGVGETAVLAHLAHQRWGEMARTGQRPERTMAPAPPGMTQQEGAGMSVGVGRYEAPGGLPSAEPQRLRVVDLDAFLDMPAPPWLIADFLDSGFSYMTGGSNAGKTFVALDIACRLAIGGWWHGLEIPKPIRVLYVAAEDPAGVALRVRAWIGKYASQVDRIALKERLSFTADTPSLADPGDQNRLVWSALEHDLTIIDTQTDVTSGINENSKQEMDALLVTMKRIVDAGKSVLMIHHPNLGEDSWKPRGIGTQLGKANTVIQVRPKDKDKPSGPIVAITRKQKHAKKGKKRTFTIVDANGAAVLEEATTGSGSQNTWLINEAIIRALYELGHEGVSQKKARELQQAVSDHILKQGWNPDTKSTISVRMVEAAAKTMKERTEGVDWTGPLWVAPAVPDEPDDEE